MKKIQVILSILLTLTIWSCNPVNQVLNDPKKSEKVFRELEKARPCNNDTIIQVKSDTATTYDIIEVPGATDTLFVDGKPTVITKIVEKEITKTRTIHDTVKIYTVDNRRLNIALDSVSYHKGVAIQKQAQIDELNVLLKEAKGKANKYFWLIILVAGLGVASHFLRSKME